MELLYRRLTVEDAAEAHLVALERAPGIGFGTYVISAPTPFAREDIAALKADAQRVIARYFPGAARVFAERGWALPVSIDRVYDAGLAERDLGFRCRTDFAAVLEALSRGDAAPVAHDADYLSPKEA